MLANEMILHRIARTVDEIHTGIGHFLGRVGAGVVIEDSEKEAMEETAIEVMAVMVRGASEETEIVIEGSVDLDETVTEIGDSVGMGIGIEDSAETAIADSAEREIEMVVSEGEFFFNFLGVKLFFPI